MERLSGRWMKIARCCGLAVFHQVRHLHVAAVIFFG